MTEQAIAETHTGSRATRILGGLTAVGMALLLLYAFVVTPADVEMGDVVRLMYIHLPSVAAAYLGFALCALGSVLYLWKRSEFWDLVAGAAAEIGVLFGAMMLVTGMIWGRPTWGTYWEWGDVRLVTSLILVLTFVGYLALRRVPGDPDTVAKRSALVALAGFALVPVVNRSVTWWADRTLHQQETVASLDPKIDDSMLFAALLGVVTFAVFALWLVVHRFRVAWLERQVERHGLDEALVARRAEGDADVAAAVTVGGATEGETP